MVKLSMYLLKKLECNPTPVITGEHRQLLMRAAFCESGSSLVVLMFELTKVSIV